MAHVNPIIPELTQHLRNVLQTLPEGKRYFVAVGGVPGEEPLETPNNFKDQERPR
jgi:hypothetical protein